MSQEGPSVEAAQADPATLQAPSEPRTPLLTALAVSVAVLAPLLAYLGNQGIAPMVALAGVLCLPLLVRNRPPSVGTGILMVLLAWGLFTTAWSPTVLGDFHRYALVEKLTPLKLALQLPLYAGFVIALLGISTGGARRAVLVLAIGLVVAAVVTAAEGALGGQLYQWIKAKAGQATSPDLAARNVARAAYAMAVLFWPAALVLWRGRVGRGAAVVLAVGALTGAVLLDADAVLAAALASVGAFLMVRFGGRPGVLACIGAVLAYLALAPLVADFATGPDLAFEVAADGKLSWAVRIDIWRDVARLVEQKPFLGWGLDASRVLPGVPLHPHDAALQVWLELGLVGVALTGLFWTWLFAGVERLARTDPPLAGAAAGSAAAYLTIGALSFGVWQEWWMALGALAIGVTVLLARSRGLVVQGRWPWDGAGAPTGA